MHYIILSLCVAHCNLQAESLLSLQLRSCVQICSACKVRLPCNVLYFRLVD